MGVDADFYLKGKWTNEQKTSFREAAKERFIWDDYSKLEEWEENEWLEFHTLSRYYGPGYERGSWPHIYAIFLLLRHHFPDTQLFYGGDSMPDECLEMTDEELSKMWAHYLSPDGENYRKSKRFRQPEFKPEILDERLEVIALEILDDDEPDPIGIYTIYENNAYRQPTEKEEWLYKMGWGRKKNRDAQIVRTNGLSDSK